MKNQEFVREPWPGERLYKALDVPPFMAGELEERWRAVVQVASLERDEYAILRGELLAEVGALVGAGGAGFWSGLFLQPSAVLKTIVVIESVLVSNTNAVSTTFGVGFGIPPAGLTIMANPRDDRIPATVAPGCQVASSLQTFQTAVNPNIGNSSYFRLAADQTLILDGPWVATSLPFIVKCVTANQSLSARIKFRERTLGRAESP